MYEINIIPLILNRFKVKNIVISGELDNETLTQILNYEPDNIHYISKGFPKINDNDDYSLNALPNLTNYDAIFINDDPNWYTVFNELKIINENNDEFPLVFICNNILPYKRRDSYFNPQIIPDNFRNEYSKEFNYKGIDLRDNLFHAVNENTPKNGVMTAIEDFLFENSSIGIFNIKLINGIIILYSKNSISQIRLSVLSEEISNYSLKYDTMIDNLIENQILREYIINFNVSPNDKENLSKYKLMLDEKEEIIKDYENKIQLNDIKLNYKDSQINSVNSKLSLKESQIKNIESKLDNSKNEITYLNNKLQTANNNIISLKNKINQKYKNHDNNELESSAQILETNSLINSLKSEISQKEKLTSELSNELKIANVKIKNNSDLLKNKQKELKELKFSLNSIKHQFTNQQSKIDNKEYCINCFKEEIKNNHLEIQYLKKSTFTKTIINPFSYLLIILKSNPKELFLNLKLYKALKNSEYFDIGFYLNNNEDIVESNWCKYFSPELHYICKGFSEKREINKKYFNKNSKKDLLSYISNCE